MNDSPPAPLGSAVAAGSTPQPLSRSAVVISVGAVWAVALAFGVLIGLLAAPAQYVSWLSLALGVCVIASFGAQLATQQKDAFVNRLAMTLTGSFIILGLFGAVLWFFAFGR